MCWRERFLTLRSSLITYTGKEFVYVIIFSLTASPRAAMIQALPASPPSPPPGSPVTQAPGAGARKGALLLPPGQPQPRTKPGSARTPLCKLSVPKTPPPASAANPQLGLCILPTAGGVPGAAEHPARQPGPPAARRTRRDMSCFGSDG